MEVVTLDEQAAVIIVVNNAMQGNQTVLSQNGSSGIGPMALGNLTFKAVDVQDESMRQTYVQALVAEEGASPFQAANYLANSLSISKEEWKEAVIWLSVYDLSLLLTPILLAKLRLKPTSYAAVVESRR